jgi:hypothetical protein
MSVTMVSLQDSATGLPREQLATARAAHVVSPSELPATLTQTHIVDLTTTRQRFEIPSGAKWVHVVFQDVGTTAVNAQFIKMVFGTEEDPLTTAEADARLATTGAHIAVGYGVPVSAAFSEDNLCLTVDVIAAAAVGSGKNLVTIVAGV